MCWSVSALVWLAQSLFYASAGPPMATLPPSTMTGLPSIGQFPSHQFMYTLILILIDCPWIAYLMDYYPADRIILFFFSKPTAHSCAYCTLSKGIRSPRWPTFPRASCDASCIRCISEWVRETEGGDEWTEGWEFIQKNATECSTSPSAQITVRKTVLACNPQFSPGWPYHLHMLGKIQWIQNQFYFGSREMPMMKTSSSQSCLNVDSLHTRWNALRLSCLKLRNHHRNPRNDFRKIEIVNI